MEPLATPFTATYRLQLHRGFTLDDASAAVPYLAALGISHVYLAPILTAAPGSMHGYDVLDHTAINPELGGRDALERLAERCHAHGLGIIVDIVPNHMALVEGQWRNAPLWDVLRNGR
ncbi:MAG TPA: alpha-amylase family glycosyl hydrolase, partial [Micropruina sp.]|nr:alpha-amylase family glycosyl hydrolase [Micropruina sp.]